MSMPKPPKLDRGRRAELEAELLRRARMWLPGWEAGDVRGDAGSAILKIAARLESEVTQRLDRLSEKSFRGFLHWLGRRGQPGRAARLPIAFRLATSAAPVLVEAPIQIQADAGGTPIIFETSKPLRLLPAQLTAVLAAEPAMDRFYGPYPGLTQWEVPKSLPDTWRLLASADVKSKRLQLDPSTGLVAGETWIADAAGNRYLVTEVKDGMVSIEPELATPLSADGPGSLMTRIAAFDPFAPEERNQQVHAIYLGAMGGLDIATAAFIEITNAPELVGCQWHYWGKQGEAPADWLQLTRQELPGGGVYLTKDAGSIEPAKIGAKEARWLRAQPKVPFEHPVLLHDVGLRFNCPPDPPSNKDRYEAYLQPEQSELKLDGIANTAPLVLNQPFYPLGREPRLFDAFYLGSDQVFSKPNATVTITVEAGESFSGPIAIADLVAGQSIIAGVAGDERLHDITVDDAQNKPTIPNFRWVSQPLDVNGRPVRLTRQLRPGAAKSDAVVQMIVAAANEVWRWDAYTDAPNSPWKSLGSPSATDQIDDTMLVKGSALFAYAIAGGKLYRRNAVQDDAWALIDAPLQRKADNGQWQDLAHLSATKLSIVRIAPVLNPADPNGMQREADGFVAIAIDKDIPEEKSGHSVLLSFAAGQWTILRVGVSVDTYPLALLRPQWASCDLCDRPSGRHRHRRQKTHSSDGGCHQRHQPQAAHDRSPGAFGPHAVRQELRLSA
jgi:hypothetical protein